MKFNRIRSVLAEKDMKNKELADLLGINPQTVSNWVTNTNQPTIEGLFKIEKVLNVELRDLLVKENPIK